MKYYYLLMLVLVFSCWLFFYCHETVEPVNTEYWNPPSPVRYLSFTHYPWNVKVPALEKSLAHGVQLQEFRLDNDTLTLRLQLYARVYAHFIDSVAIKDNCFTIMLGDTASARARYFNSSHGDFKFIYPYEKSAVRVIFKWWDYPDNTFKTPLDTIIHLY